MNMSQDLVRLRIASSNLVPNRPDLDAGPLFFLAVDYAQKHQIDRLIADPGVLFPELAGACCPLRMGPDE
jgi:hypothetical protein